MNSHRSTDPGYPDLEENQNVTQGIINIPPQPNFQYNNQIPLIQPQIPP